MDIDAFLDGESGSSNSVDTNSSAINSGNNNKSKVESVESVQKTQETTFNEDSANFSYLIKQIENIKKLLVEKKFEEAQTKYLLTKEDFLKYTKKQSEEQNQIYSALEIINQNMVIGLNNQKQEAIKKIEIIEQLLSKCVEHINNNDLNVANQLFNEIDKMHKTLPDIVTDKKIKLEQNIASVHIMLLNKSSYANNVLFQSKFSEIRGLLAQAFDDIKLGNINDVLQIYQQVNSLYSDLPKGFLYEKAILHQEIMKLFKAVNQLHSKNISQNDNNNSQLNQNMNNGNDNPSKNGINNNLDNNVKVNPFNNNINNNLNNNLTDNQPNNPNNKFVDNKSNLNNLNMNNPNYKNNNNLDEMDTPVPPKKKKGWFF